MHLNNSPFLRYDVLLVGVLLVYRQLNHCYEHVAGDLMVWPDYWKKINDGMAFVWHAWMKLMKDVMIVDQRRERVRSLTVANEGRDANAYLT